MENWYQVSSRGYFARPLVPWTLSMRYFRPKIEVKEEKEPEETGLEGIRKASKLDPSDSDSEHYEYIVEDIPRETCNFGSMRPLPEKAFIGAKTLSDSE